MRRLVLLVCLCAGILAEQCSVVPKCSCNIGDEDVKVNEQYTGSEALTGAVGALGSVAVSGGAISVWYLIKKKKMNSVSLSSSSDVSNLPGDNMGQGFQPRSRPPNIYNAGRNDNLFPSVGSK